MNVSIYYMEKLYFIITAGATGSGKTGLIDETMKYLNISGQKYKKIFIDDLVENDGIYKNKVRDIIEQVASECGSSETCEIDAFNNPKPELLKSFEQSYFDTRKGKGCNNTDLTCDELNDKILAESQNEDQHIILETTGSYIPAWLLDDAKYVNNKYTIVFSYSLVNLENLIERNKSRAYKSIKDFENNPELPAPRLPDVSKDNFKTVVVRIKETLIDLYGSCINTHDNKKCGTRKINQLLLFDNNISLKNIFDSNIQKTFSINEFKDLIDKSFGSLDGGYKDAYKPRNRKSKKSNKTRRSRRNKKSRKPRHRKR